MNIELVERELREKLISLGVVTKEQASAVTIRLVNPADFPDIPRCTCDDCKGSSSFAAFGVDDGVLSPFQIKAIALVANEMLKPNLPIPTDPEKWNGNDKIDKVQ